MKMLSLCKPQTCVVYRYFCQYLFTSTYFTLLPRQPAIKYMWINMINVEFSSFSINKMLAFLCRAFVEFESQEQK